VRVQHAIFTIGQRKRLYFEADNAKAAIGLLVRLYCNFQVVNDAIGIFFHVPKANRDALMVKVTRRNLYCARKAVHFELVAVVVFYEELKLVNHLLGVAAFASHLHGEIVADLVAVRCLAIDAIRAPSGFGLSSGEPGGW